MRRTILLALGLGIFGAAVGCHHVAGVCDCEGPGCACGGAPLGALHAEAPAPYGEVVAPASLQAETIDKAPRILNNGPALK